MDDELSSITADDIRRAADRLSPDDVWNAGYREGYAHGKHDAESTQLPLNTWALFLVFAVALIIGVVFGWAIWEPLGH